MNLLEPPQGAHWGEFNDRKVDNKWVARLAAGFLSHLDNCTDETAIELAVKKEWLKDASKALKTVEGREMKDICAMEFTAEGLQAISNNNLWILGGNHRRAALRVYMNEKVKALQQARAESEALEAEGDAKKGEQEEAKKRIGRVAEEIDAASQWVVKLYDRGE